MGHCIQAIIVPREGFQPAAFPSVWPKPVELPQGFLLFPIFDAILDAISTNENDRVASGFTHLGQGLLSFLRRASENSPLVYFETEYFGGMGSQGAVAMARGQISFGPSSSEGDEINRALAVIGVKRENYADEFEALGLQRFRHMDSFAEFDRFSGR